MRNQSQAKTGSRNPLSLKAYMIPDGVHVRLYYFIVVLKQKPRVAFWLFEAVVESGYFICLSKFAQSRLVRETAFENLITKIFSDGASER